MSDKNKFIADKVQKYFKDSMKNIEYVENEPKEYKEPIKIPKITRKEQIYWICEECGVSNPYFLPKCKNCKQERSSILYENYENVNILNNKIHVKRPISQVITEYWQTIEEIAEKMGIRDTEEILFLKNKLRYLVEVNYLIPNLEGTMYKINNFQL